MECDILANGIYIKLYLYQMVYSSQILIYTSSSSSLNDLPLYYNKVSLYEKQTQKMGYDTLPSNFEWKLQAIISDNCKPCYWYGTSENYSQ